MKYKSYDYRCTKCGHVCSELFEKDKQSNMIDCEKCGSIMGRTIGAPMVLKASFPDGQDRGEKWNLTKEAAALEQEAAKKHNRKNKKSILAEATKLVKRVANKKDKAEK